MTLRDTISPVGVVQPITEVSGYTLVLAETLPGTIEAAIATGFSLLRIQRQGGSQAQAEKSLMQ